ncbi:hypothetical protein [Kaistella pullorum]|uniref:Secreted protein n=1 Tax=Kaistella pullorum TaxID=2763074 RepID=A0ABR8WL14_9FLAO|nr:hypothetical protein [Kaistella pullorum]MBD8017685.1 hypothetical protein [Kaistella pullorum]
MKKLLFGLAVVFSSWMSAQIYQDYYPTSGSSVGYYEEYDDEFYFPDDYYYEYPSDYYTQDFYRSYYDDYRRSIYDVNWNRFFSMYRLSPWQIREIMMLNDQFQSYNAWNSFYRYNPDRWYYDRFYALERILGPRIFVIFQNNYYHGYNPVIYYQNYRRQHYAPHVYIVPRYRNINVNRYRVDRVQYHKTNPRQKIGFRDTPGNANAQNVAPRANGFRDHSTPNTADTKGLRNGTAPAPRTAPRQNDNTRQNGMRTPNESLRNDSGFRNDNNSGNTKAPLRKMENSAPSPRQQSPATGNPGMSAGTPGMRLTSR